MLFRSHFVPASGTYFTVHVRENESVSDIAHRYQVDQEDIVAINNLRDKDDARPGEALRIPAYGRWRDRTADRDYRAPEPTRAASPTPLPERKPAQPIERREEPALVREAKGDAKFLWPVKGQVLSNYGSQRSGERNDGIDIAASSGAPARAAAAGVVTYAGNELKGYGNLVLIRHDNGFVTAYAHNKRLAVSRGDRVQSGQVIGYAGSTGDVDSPQVHFELRRSKRPVDPRRYLVVASN